MSFRILAVAAALALSAVAGAAPAATPINISAASGVGETKFFAAGTYTIDFVSDVYSGWSFWGGAAGGCSDTGVNCTAGFTNLFNFSLDGVDTLVIKNVAGSQYGYGMYGSKAQALAAYQAGGLSTQAGGGAYVPVIGPLTFTVGAGGANVHFYINDGDYRDNGDGGVSLSITAAAVPEPASWALMIGGFGLAGAALRQRRRMLAA